MEEIKVVNIKCGGCTNHIKKELEKQGAKQIEINLEAQAIKFEGDRNKIEKKLIELGYPPANSKEAKSILKKAKSYVSCAFGKIQK